MPEKIRLFIGIDLPEHIKTSLENIIRELKSSIDGARWVPRENLHVTLKFLGSVELTLMKEIVEKISGALRDLSWFDYNLSEIGAFPSLKSARVFWVGTSEGSEKIESLFKTIDSSLKFLHLKEEKRKFHSHITLARLKINKKIDLNMVEDIASKVPSDILTVEEITLFQSELSPQGAKYKVLERFSLKAE